MANVASTSSATRIARADTPVRRRVHCRYAATAASSSPERTASPSPRVLHDDRVGEDRESRLGSMGRAVTYSANRPHVNSSRSPDRGRCPPRRRSPPTRRPPTSSWGHQHCDTRQPRYSSTRSGATPAAVWASAHHHTRPRLHRRGVGAGENTPGRIGPPPPSRRLGCCRPGVTYQVGAVEVDLEIAGLPAPFVLTSRAPESAGADSVAPVTVTSSARPCWRPARGFHVRGHVGSDHEAVAARWTAAARRSCSG
jgi:hypothetical protein